MLLSPHGRKVGLGRSRLPDRVFLHHCFEYGERKEGTQPTLNGRIGRAVEPDATGIGELSNEGRDGHVRGGQAVPIEPYT